VRYSSRESTRTWFVRCTTFARLAAPS
jgi:hypothetical protein